MKKIFLTLLLLLFPLLLCANDFDKGLLIGSDAILVSVAALSCADYSGSSTAYETLYSALNNTTVSNYSILVYEKQQVERKGTYMAVLSGIAGLAVIYTLADLFIFHNVFDMPVKISIIPQKQYAGLSKDWRF